MKYLFISLIITLVTPMLSNAKDHEYKKMFKTANDMFIYEDYERALPLFLKLYEYDTADAEINMKIGVCYLNGDKHRARSLSYLIDATMSEDTVIEAFYYLGQAYHLANAFDEAIKTYETFKSFLIPEKNKEIIEEVNREIEQCNNAKEYFANRNRDVVIANVGAPISSAYSEYSPLITDNGNMLIFTYRGEGCKGGKEDVFGNHDPDGSYMEDVFVSYKEEGKWSIPEGISDNINSKLHDACVGASPDGKILLLYKNDDHGGGDIWMSRRSGKNWSKPIQLPEPINSKYSEESAFISSDEKVIYFSSDRPGGLGGKDIYVSYKEGSVWSEPINLGPNVNTKYDEDAPYLHTSKNTLYFSSKGHKNMGGYDVYKTTVSNGGNDYSEPINMGLPINTSDDDTYFSITEDGIIAYLSSERVRPCHGYQDIYFVIFIESDSEEENFD